MFLWPEQIDILAEINQKYHETGLGSVLKEGKRRQNNTALHYI